MTASNTDRQKIHIDVRKSDLETLALIGEELDLKQVDLIRLAIIEFNKNHGH